MLRIVKQAFLKLNITRDNVVSSSRVVIGLENKVTCSYYRQSKNDERNPKPFNGL